MRFEWPQISYDCEMHHTVLVLVTMTAIHTCRATVPQPLGFDAETSISLSINANQRGLQNSAPVLQIRSSISQCRHIQ
jgi:hypothetical protein